MSTPTSKFGEIPELGDEKGTRRNVGERVRLFQWDQNSTVQLSTLAPSTTSASRSGLKHKTSAVFENSGCASTLESTPKMKHRSGNVMRRCGVDVALPEAIEAMSSSETLTESGLMGELGAETERGPVTSQSQAMSDALLCTTDTTNRPDD